MADRKDVLGPDRQRLHAMSGDVLRPVPDAILQRLVEEAARKLDVPISLVSLVLDTIQFFRAHHGLPPELAAVRATSRDTSFAQYVVRDAATVAVNDFDSDDRLPRDLVDRYGLRAYLGVPLHVGERTGGALEVLDRRPREWHLVDRARLLRIAGRVERRLAQLAERQRAEDEQGSVDDLHEEMLPLQVAVIEARVAALELDALSSLERGGERDRELASALTSLSLVRSRLARATLATNRILDAFGRLREDEPPPPPTVPLSTLTDAADAVARPLTSQVGGVRWRLPEGPCPVAVPPPIGIALLSTTLITLVGLLLSRMRQSPIDARTELDEGVVRIAFESAAMERRDGLAVVAALSQLGVRESVTRVELTGDEVCIMLPIQG